MKFQNYLLLFIMPLCFWVLTLPTLAAEAVTELISINQDGTPSGGISTSISGDGRYFVFTAEGEQLLYGNIYDGNKVFVHDRLTNTTTMVSVNPYGSPVLRGSGEGKISSNGRYIAFTSNEEGICRRIFIHDRLTGETSREDASTGGYDCYSSSPTAPSPDGRFVAFAIDGHSGRSDIFLYDRLTGETKRVNVDSAGNEADTHGWSPSISSDGRYISFESYATNLVPNDTNRVTDAFVHDSQTGETTRVSVSSSGEEANGRTYCSSISANGRFVVFTSEADNLVANDTNGIGDTFRHDIKTGITERVSVDKYGNQGEGPIGYPDSRCFISSSGRYVAFESHAANLVDNDTNGGAKDMFIKDMLIGTVKRVEYGYGTTNSSYKGLEGISADGNFITFTSDSNHLVPEDKNSLMDVYVNGPLLAPKPPPKPDIKMFIPAIPGLLLLSQP